MNSETKVFLKACEEEVISVIKILINNDKIDPFANGNVVAKTVIKNDNIEILKSLFSHPKVNKTAFGMVAISHAIEYNKLEILKLLIEYLQLTNLEGIFYTVAEKGYLEIMSYLLTLPLLKHNLNRPFKRAAENGQFEMVKLLLQDKRVDPFDGAGDSIRWAARNKHRDIVILLLKDSRLKLDEVLEAAKGYNQTDVINFITQVKEESKSVTITADKVTIDLTKDVTVEEVQQLIEIVAKLVTKISV